MKHYRQLWLGTLGATLFVPQMALADISGTVFRDFNANGTQDSAEPLVAGVLVKAFDSSGNQCGTTQTTTAGGTPNYSLAGCSGSVRVEFETPASGCQIDKTTDFSALGGDAYGTSVQFLSNGSIGTANFAVHYPGEYGGSAGNTPKLFNVVMRAGDPLASAPAGDESYTANQSTVLASDYFIDSVAATDTPWSKTAAQRQLGHTVLAKASQTGTLWGNAYSAPAKRLFVSAFVRRHAGLGPLGAGGIYMIDPANPNLSANLGFVSLDNLGFPTHAASGTYNIKSNSARSLPAVPAGVPTHDTDAYQQVGKTALGDLDISADGRYLFTVNLYDRKLYRLDLQNPAAPIVPTAAQVTAYDIPNTNCTGTAGEYRPFGIKTHRNKLYVGTVCSGENAAESVVGTSATMKLNVFEYDANNLVTAPTLHYSQDLSYRDSTKLHSDNVSGQWFPWKTSYDDIGYNAPLLTDIEFDNQGNMLLGLADRNSYQTGSANYPINSAQTSSRTKYYGNGDIIKLNRDASCHYTPATGTYVNNDFYDDAARWIRTYSPATCGTNGSTCHNETPLGGITTHRFGDHNEVVGAANVPVTATSNGYVAWDNTTGAQVRANEIWFDPNYQTSPNSFFGKAGGLGDLETLSEVAPIEIGNRVWLDTDNDGLQDAGENGIPNVQVQLLSGATVVATATTAADGTYYFTNAAGTDTTSKKFGLTQLQPNTAYTVKFPTTVTVSGTAYNLTTATAGGNTLIDSNAPTSGEVTVAAADIPTAGANNHSFDVGYSSEPPPTGCTTITNNASITQSGISDPVAGNNSASAAIQVNCTTPKTDLKLVKTASKTTVRKGDTLTYTLVLENESDVDATGVVVNDKLPTAMTYVSHAPATASYDSATGNWTVGTLAARQKITLTIDVTVN